MNNKSILIALVIIGLVVAVLLNNPEPIRIDLYFDTFHPKQSLVFLGFFVTGIVTGLLLKGQ